MMTSLSSLIIILLVAVISAVLKSLRDYNIKKNSLEFNEYARKWHLYGFIAQGLLFSLTAALLGFITREYWVIPLLVFIGGMLYWAVFDCVIGYLLTGSIWHIGTTGWDVLFEQMFYNGWTFLGFKLFWMTLAILAYRSFFII